MIILYLKFPGNLVNTACRNGRSDPLGTEFIVNAGRCYGDDFARQIFVFAYALRLMSRSVVVAGVAFCNHGQGQDLNPHFRSIFPLMRVVLYQIW